MALYAYPRLKLIRPGNRTSKEDAVITGQLIAQQVCEIET